jgi:hypothetical protein
MAYNAALSAHSNHARALSEATMRGEIPPPEFIEAEKHALQRLEKLHAAMAASIGSPPEPPPPTKPAR